MTLEEDARWLEWVTKQFESIAGDDKEIDLEEFKTALNVKEVDITQAIVRRLCVVSAVTRYVLKLSLM